MKDIKFYFWIGNKSINILKVNQKGFDFLLIKYLNQSDYKIEEILISILRLISIETICKKL